MIIALVDTDPFRQLDQKTLYQEYAFIDTSRPSRSKGVIDLLIVGRNQAWIIDYKLKKIDDPAYLNQLAGYKAYVEHLIHKPVSTYLFSLLDHSLHLIGGTAT
jgi:ATP-dependent exoDNAse (exonuclease V) beta subunit